MTTPIYITLLVLVIISGLMAISPKDTSKETKEKTPIEQSGFTNTAEMKNHLYSRLIALTVFVLSLASMMAMYFIKG